MKSYYEVEYWIKAALIIHSCSLSFLCLLLYIEVKAVVITVSNRLIMVEVAILIFMMFRSKAIKKI